MWRKCTTPIQLWGRSRGRNEECQSNTAEQSKEQQYCGHEAGMRKHSDCCGSLVRGMSARYRYFAVSFLCEGNEKVCSSGWWSSSQFQASTRSIHVPVCFGAPNSNRGRSQYRNFLWLSLKIIWNSPVNSRVQRQYGTLGKNVHDMLVGFVV